MKKILKGSFPIVVLFAILLLSACKGKDKQAETKEVTKYTCPMHPQIVKDAPGSCPICGMDLVPMNAPGKDGGVNDTLAALVKPTNEVVLSGIKSIKPQTGPRFQDINIKGVINYNTNYQNSVSSRVRGRIEKLYVKYNYQPVSKGQKLMDIYSPDLASAQQELLFLKNNNEPALLEQAKKKLRLLGATEQQIKQILITGKVDYTVSIYSPYTGYVAELQNASVSANGASSAGGTMIASESSEGGSSMGEMGGSSPSSASNSTASIPDVATNSPLRLREGHYVSVGQKIFNLVNSNVIWAEFYVNPADLDKFKVGTMIEVQSVDVKAKKNKVPVSLVQPYYSQGTYFSLVRATVTNSDKSWKVGELINVKSESTRKIGTWLPRTAVLQLGTRYVSFIKKNNAFLPIYVNVKSVLGDWIDIGDSINMKQDVALNAWFLVDSESFINVQNITAQ
ncbi:Multidrug resistance efflux pump [Daejeonella rubra]|uniref:Multidrug resistance efflux pump n=1 Tax=Daejeonella rubra TaxID=990371 RepID=A0A1G9NN55_9SPHI|nr:efflux RND transporter periplasmic adaptor subunit [Daejeonella rubra]SDL87771.1 Multidrug resistance efflux pump [Daejeonella rubra]